MDETATICQQTLNVLDKLTADYDPYLFYRADKKILQDITGRVIDIFAEKGMTYEEAYSALKVIAKVLEQHSKKIIVQRKK